MLRLRKSRLGTAGRLSNLGPAEYRPRADEFAQLFSAERLIEISVRGTIKLAAVVLLGLGFATTAAGAETDSSDQYVLCTFRPQTQICSGVYEQAMRGASPSASALKAAFEDYGRYVRNAHGELTDDDKKYLADNAIQLPPDLAAEDQAGLHSVITDPTLRKDANALRLAVNGFLSRAVQAELYCGFNNCAAGDRTAAADEGGAAPAHAN